MPKCVTLLATVCQVGEDLDRSFEETVAVTARGASPSLTCPFYVCLSCLPSAHGNCGDHRRLSNGRNRSEILTAASEGDSDRGKYYDVRVWLAGDKYAWTLPVFVD